MRPDFRAEAHLCGLMKRRTARCIGHSDAPGRQQMAAEAAAQLSTVTLPPVLAMPRSTALIRYGRSSTAGMIV